MSGADGLGGGIVADTLRPRTSYEIRGSSVYMKPPRMAHINPTTSVRCTRAIVILFVFIYPLSIPQRRTAQAPLFTPLSEAPATLKASPTSLVERSRAQHLHIAIDWDMRKSRPELERLFCCGYLSDTLGASISSGMAIISLHITMSASPTCTSLPNQSLSLR